MTSPKQAFLFDETFLPFSKVVKTLGQLNGRTSDIDEGVQMDIESIKIGLPIQMEIVKDKDNNIQIGGVPPLHYVETSFNPVFHQITLELVVNE